MQADIEEALPRGPFACVYADPPWAWKTWSKKGLDGRPQHYRRMTYAEILAMPVKEITAPDCFLFMWITGPMLERAFPVIEAWGFAYSGIGFSWLKLNKTASPGSFRESDLFMGGGYTTRKNVELCLIGRKGSPQRQSKSVREPIVSPRREHSRKPDQAVQRIETFCRGPYLELFGRQQREGWTVFGNESTKFGEAA